MFDHEVDGFGGNELGGHEQVAFVFAVFGIGDDDHFAGFEVSQDFGDGGNGGGHGTSIPVGGLWGGCGRTVVGVEPQRGHAGAVFDFAGFALAEGLVFQQGGEFALVDAGGGDEINLPALVQAVDPFAQVAAAQFGNIDGAGHGLPENLSGRMQADAVAFAIFDKGGKTVGDGELGGEYFAAGRFGGTGGFGAVGTVENTVMPP